MTQPIAEADGRHRLDPERNAHRESLVWVVPEPQKGLTTFAYTWVNAEGLAGAALAVFGRGLEAQIFEKVDGIEVPSTMTFDEWRVGPLAVSLARDGSTSRMQFEGGDASLTLDFSGFHTPYRYGTHRRGCPSFFADDRLEQSGSARGTLWIGDRRVDFDTPAQRDHSWGTRDWAAMHHMKWVNALTESGQAVHAVELLAFGQRYLRGYVNIDGRLSPLADLDMGYDLNEHMLHTEIDAIFRDEEGREVAVQFFDGGPHFEWDVNPRLTLRDTAMRVSVAGEPGVGYVDMSWDPSYFAHHATNRSETNRIEAP